MAGQATVLAFVVLAAILIRALHRSKSYRPPPGPRPLPVIGNVKDLPPSHEWIGMAQLAKKYGDVMQLSLPTFKLVVLSSPQAAKDLLEARNSIYSCRPRFPMISELMGWSFAVQFMPFSPRFTKTRKCVQAQLRPQALSEYHPTLHVGILELLEGILSKPDGALGAIRHAAGGTMMSVIYGTPAGAKRDAYVRMADDAIEGLCDAGNIGTFLVDLIPALKYVPSWFPGANFKRKAAIWKQMARDMIEIPFHDVRRQINDGTAPPSIMRSLLLQKQKELKLDSIEVDEDDLMKGTGGVIFLGGADTMLAVLHTFILAMLLHPEVQRRAHAELDLLLQSQTTENGDVRSSSTDHNDPRMVPLRLPELSDRDALPYIQAIVLEVMRWYPAVPLGVPHRLIQDDEYKGMWIRGGSTVVVNQWAIFRNESIYPQPEKFIPERFLPPSQDESAENSPRADPGNESEIWSAPLDPRTIAFGFGKRKCPGRHYADDALWLNVASLLFAFSIEPAKNELGEEIIPEERFVTGLVSRPESFPVMLKPRSEEIARLIRDQCQHGAL